MNVDPKPSIRRFFTACNVLIAANTAVMVFVWLKYPIELLWPSQQTLLDIGGNQGLLTLSGQYWRLLTSMFVHVGIFHLGLNMFSLWCVGPTAESLFGWRMFLLIYFFSGIIGALTSTMHDPLQLSVGASGAILGVFGSLVAFLFVQRDKYPRSTVNYYAALAVGLFTAVVFYGFISPGIDTFAHVAGFLAGIFAGLLLARLDVSERRRMIFAIPIMALMIGLWYWCVQDNFVQRGYGKYEAAIKAYEAKNYPEAVTQLNAFLLRNKDDIGALAKRGIAYSKMSDFNRSVADFTRIMELSPQMAEPYNSRAWIEIGMKQYERAIRDATISLELRPRAPGTYDTRACAYWKLGETDKALDDFSRGLKIDPNDTASHYHRMKLLQSLGRNSEANADRPAAALYEREPWED
jgi:membrane associated rhomboid family serine protease